MKKRIYFYLLSLLIVSYSCTDNVEDYDNHIINFSSYKELQTYLKFKVQESDTTTYQFETFPKVGMNLRSGAFPQSNVGYHTSLPYDGCSFLGITISSHQDASKLGVIAYQKYYITIYKVSYAAPLAANWLVGMDNSPFCGLILFKPRTDDFLNAERGYSGAYDKSSLKYTMTTSLVKFEKKKDDDKPI